MNWEPKSDGDIAMTEATTCTYEGDRTEALLAYLYGDEPADDGGRGRFATHVAVCNACRDELAALRGVRARLTEWTPPEPAGALARHGAPPRVIRRPWPALAAIPAWAQIAAASLIVGVSVGIANVHVQYGDGRLTIQSGWWSDPAEVAAQAGAAPAAAAEPWRAEIAALRSELQDGLAAAHTPAVADVQPGGADAGTLMREVRALIAESDRRHERELALRVGEAMRDLNAQRRADLVNIDRSLGTLQNNLGMEMLKQREQLNNYVLRVSSQK